LLKVLKNDPKAILIIRFNVFVLVTFASNMFATQSSPNREILITRAQDIRHYAWEFLTGVSLYAVVRSIEDVQQLGL
jgi:hypothetical protein